MGTNKTQLLARDRYGLLKAAELAAEMIAHYERCRDGAWQIRVEAPGVAVWDDAVVRHNTHTDMWQVKSQTTPLNENKAREIIASVFPTLSSSNSPATRLHLGLAELVAVGTGKKPVLECRDLRVLCDSARAPGLDVAAFANIQSNEPAFQFVVANAPQGTPPSAIVAALAALHVHRLGNEHDLRRTAVSHLEDLFTNAEDVVTQLHNWLLQHSDGLIQIDSNLLHEHVLDQHAKRDAARGRWVHFSRSGASTWETRGSLVHADIVRSAWVGPEKVRLQVGSKPYAADPNTGALSRLMVHRTREASVEAADTHEWQTAAARACGETLGVTTDALPLMFGIAPAAHPHPSRRDFPANQLATALSDAMDEYVWAELSLAVPARLHEEMFAPDVRGAALALWDRWLAQLAQPRQRAALIQSMLVTAEEARRPGFDASVRSGRLLIPDLARALALALAIGVGLEAHGTPVTLALDGWPQNLTLRSRSAHLIALVMASHPQTRRPCLLADDLGEMLAEETDLAILAGVQANATELYEVAREASVPFHASPDAATHLQHTGPLVPLLTASPTLMSATKKSVEAVKQHVAEQMNSIALHRDSQLRQAIAEAVANG